LKKIGKKGKESRQRDSSDKSTYLASTRPEFKPQYRKINK
jgi:hypothetical protein